MMFADLIFDIGLFYCCLRISLWVVGGVFLGWMVNSVDYRSFFSVFILILVTWLFRGCLVFVRLVTIVCVCLVVVLCLRFSLGGFYLRLILGW